MAQLVQPNLSLNLNQFFQKHILLNDLQYDYYSKYLAAACKSQGGSEVVILTKEGSLLNVLSYFNTEYEPVFVSWAPPTLSAHTGYGTSHSSSSDNVLVVVTTENALCMYKNSSNCVGAWDLVFRSTELSKSISCLATTGVPGTAGGNVDNLLVALGSHLGVVTVVPLNTLSLPNRPVNHRENTPLENHSVTGSVETLNAHNGGVTALGFSSPDPMSGNKLMLATGGLDNTVKLWEYEDNFMLKKVLKLAPSEETCTTYLGDGAAEKEGHRALKRVSSLAFSKRGELAAATDSSVYIFGNAHDWVLFQVLSLGTSHQEKNAGGPSGALERHGERGLVLSFSNDKLVLMRDTESYVLKRSDKGLFEMESRLER
ncbi:uncharacterized protein TOT_030000826 [Theileria orientalis strain Shintoku]|uniref:Uncharacterized protein n=1 Tax=Theileria orientalis strain Shintoku TaxID=869250 RepID=J4C8X8_THEOR|nr:uncharacterized protein TOT_030000826 [Theileria orientalis strain Shintoku]BAM41563.1 uncharacterized protein TOT_030000826 [Theileria orientalis strain Shintoku]|eukprot:XP_009691864.1 uncharacterized protein TOT_030000826 [Theileria orientalis strain Shintoku]